MKTRSLLVLFVVVLAGCGGGSPLTFWLITVDQTPPAVCVPAPTAQPTMTDTQTGFVQASTWELYPGAKDASGKDTYVLVAAAQGQNQALEGTKDGNKYTFNGSDTRVDKSPTAEAPTRTQTDTTTTAVTFTIDGSTMSGSSTQTDTHSCAGTNCPMGGTPPPCSMSTTTTTTFHGAQVNAEIKHDV